MPIEMDDRGRALENEYFHRKEQELLEKMRAKLGDEKAGSAGMACPRCDGTLIETEHQNIAIDVCDKCTGVWLDAGELAQIAALEDGKESSGWFGGLFS
ncbi:MAG: zf-TFIIB domain-containing protein [Acidobacteriota bacterium]